MKKLRILFLGCVLCVFGGPTFGFYSPTAQEKNAVTKIEGRLDTLYVTHPERFDMVRDFLDRMMDKHELGSKKYRVAWKLSTYMKNLQERTEIIHSIPKISASDMATLKQHVPDELRNSRFWIVEFTDLECPFCKRHHDQGTLQQVVDKHDDVAYVQLSFPLSFHPNAYSASQMGLCVWRYDGYAAYKKYVAGVFSAGRLSSDKIDDVALFVSSHDTEVSNCFKNGDTKRGVDAQLALGRSLGVTGTPGNILIDTQTGYYTKVSGAVPASAFDLPLTDMKLGNYESLFGGHRPSSYPQPVVPKPAPSVPSAPVLPTSVDADLYDTFLDTAYIQGPANAEVTIIEFTDFECPFCKRHYENGTVKTVMGKYDGKVNSVTAHFPLSFHKNAKKAAEGAECVGKMGGQASYVTFIDKVFSTDEQPTGEVMESMVRDMGLDVQNFVTCLENDTFEQKVNDQITFGKSLGVTGTPGHIVVNNTTREIFKVSGAVPASAFDGAIEKLLEG